MNNKKINDILKQLEIRGTDLAQLLYVTPRAVNMWSSGVREMPGPAKAYIELLNSLPTALKIKELERLNKKEPIMYEGMYLINFRGSSDTGTGVLIFQNGIIFGHDSGVLYDGTYRPNHENNICMDVNLTLRVTPGTPLVTGVPPQQQEYSFQILLTVPVNPTERLIQIETPFGSVEVVLNYLRELPSPLAA